MRKKTGFTLSGDMKMKKLIVASGFTLLLSLLLLLPTLVKAASDQVLR
jgi:hypothetical protein